MKLTHFKTACSIVTIVIMGATMQSCKKYLEVVPASSFDPSFVFNSVENAKKAVLGVYGNLGGDNGYGIRLSMYYPYDEDCMMGQGGTPYPDGERRDISHYNLTAANTQLAGPYNQLYTTVERANLCIYFIPKMELYSNGSAAEIAELKRLHGEALTLRAMVYTELIRNWGDIPEQFVPSFSETNLYKGKTDRDSIYNILLNDLKMAEDLVPWRSAVAKDDRITQGAVRALRARIALYRGGYSLRRNRQMMRGSDYQTYYQIAKDECAAIMARPGDHTLNSSYRSVFKDYICGRTNEPNGEVMLEVSMDGGTSALGDSKLGYYNGPRGNGTGLGNSALTVLPNYFYSFDSTDLRRDVMCVPYNITNASGTLGSFRTLTTMVDGKFRRDWIQPNVLTSAAQYFGLNWPVIRFSDVLLMFAEADNELNNGPTPAAFDAINKVRRRGYGKPINTPDVNIDLDPALTKSTFFNAIVRERALEFGGEGIRKYDLIRWNLLAAKIAEVKALLPVMVARSAAPWNGYPSTMYFLNNSTTLQYAGSYYKPNVSPAPAGYTGVNWLHSSITTTILPYYALAFTTGKSELLPLPQATIDANPNLVQDYGY
jgi:starch-binding outer membrane protein, SusD/RagB family